MMYRYGLIIQGKFLQLEERLPAATTTNNVFENVHRMYPGLMGMTPDSGNNLPLQNKCEEQRLSDMC
jgi:hypothetical protein